MFLSCIKSARIDISESPSTIIFDNTTYKKIESAFQMRGIKGCFVLYDQENDTSIIYNQARSVQLFLPASTFKIPNAVIVLQCGVFEDQNGQYIFRSKTGWSNVGQPAGWYVGYIVYEEQTFIFVNNIDMNNN